MSGYTLKRSSKAKYMRLTVRPGGNVVLTAPIFESTRAIERFLADKAGWIARSVARMRHLKVLPGGKREYGARRSAARAFIHERLLYWNSFYHFTYHRVAIKNTTSLWGSCSRKGNLNFSYKLIFLPRELSDYVIVHELCHLREPNHGPHFWALVAEALPDYQPLRRELKKYILRN